MGNHAHHAHKRHVTHPVSYAHMEVSKPRCPSLLSQVLGVAEWYGKIMTQYGDCRETFYSAQSTNNEQFEDLAVKIEVFMLSARKEVIERGLSHFTVTVGPTQAAPPRVTRRPVHASIWRRTRGAWRARRRGISCRSQYALQHVQEHRPGTGPTGNGRLTASPHHITSTDF